VIQRVLGKLIVAIDREDDCAALLRACVLGRVIFDPAHERSSLVSEADAKKKDRRRV
jgi:hypothetical protein